MTTKGLLKAHMNIEVVARSHFHVFPTNDGRYAVAYHIAGSLWSVVGDAPEPTLAREMCENMNREHHGTSSHSL
jgi:hypothetical protein